VVARKIHQQAQIVTDGDLSANLTSAAFNILAYRSFSLHAEWTGVPVGDFQLQVSNDGSNWFDQGSSVAAGGGADEAMFSEQFSPWAYARLDYTSTSGTGTLNVFALAKE
jgi:hypothetical protein